tara:strand:- start:286 stop:492 length:207 start_codon:yes stop_codon:yes gene_type:complete
MKHAITVFIRDKANKAIYYPALPGNRDNPPDPDELELVNSPNLCPDQHRLLYADLIKQARIALYGIDQ